jgi:hypothetical protein
MEQVPAADAEGAVAQLPWGMVGGSAITIVLALAFLSTEGFWR